MFDFFASSQFYTSVLIGCILAYFAGFANVSRGAVFQGSFGPFLILAANGLPIAVAVLIAVSTGIVAGIVAAVVFWFVAGIGSARYTQKYGA
jgi:hypothetical protein